MTPRSTGAFDRNAGVPGALWRRGASSRTPSTTSPWSTCRFATGCNSTSMAPDSTLRQVSRVRVTSVHCAFTALRDRSGCCSGAQRLLHEASSGPEKRTGSWSAGFVLPQALNVQWTLLVALFARHPLPSSRCEPEYRLAGAFRTQRGTVRTGNSSAEPRIDRQHGRTAPPVVASTSSRWPMAVGAWRRCSTTCACASAHPYRCTTWRGRTNERT